VIIFTQIVLVLFTIVTIHCECKREGKSQINTPPIIEEVTVLPFHPTIESEITVRILGSDADEEPITLQIIHALEGINPEISRRELFLVYY